MRALLSFVALQAGWFACVLGAARGWPWLGPPCVMAILALHLASQRARGRELGILAMTSALGFLFDTSFIQLGWIRIDGASVAPAWLVVLWPLFASTTAEGGSLRSLARRPRFAALLGAVGGPLAYVGGARLGALTLGSPRTLPVVLLAVLWAAFVPALFGLRARAERAGRLSTR